MFICFISEEALLGWYLQMSTFQDDGEWSSGNWMVLALIMMWEATFPSALYKLIEKKNSF